MTAFTRLVAYGCSYTQGSEILDERYLPGAEKLKRERGLDAFWTAFNKKFNDVTYESYINEAKQYAWPRHLADKFAIPWDNRARPGYSTSNMIYNIDRDLVNGDITNTDLVIIGITSSERLIRINDAGYDRTLHLGYIDTFPAELAKGYPYFVNWFNDPTLKFYFSVELRALLYLASTKLKGQLYFVECDPHALYIKEYINPPLAEKVVNTLDPIYSDFINSGLLISKEGFYQNQPPECTLAGGHLNEDAHKRWAEHIYQNCIRKGLTA